MIADLKPYAEYKESGVPWLGHVPGHWTPTKLKHAFSRIVGGSTPASGAAKYWDGDVTWVTPADVSRSERLRRSIRQISRAGMVSCSTQLVPKGSIILTTRAPVGNVSIADVELCTNQGCKALIPDSSIVVPMFGFWLLSVMKAEIQSLSTGTTFSEVSNTRLGATVGILPPPAEQAAIVRFLDWANARLERAIRAKRKVIALLGEQKQAIIHRAVTRSPDPSVPLKPSGIPWLGDIPQHWAIERTKNVFRLRTEKSGVSHGKELLSIYTHIGVRPRKDLEQKGNKASTTDNYWIVQKGDLIVNKLLAWMGAVGSSDYDGVTSPAYDILMPIRPLCSDYYHNLFRTKLYLQLFKQRSRGIMDMRLRLYFDQLGQIPIPFPPVEEQAAIVAFYVEETANLTAAISRLEREIELLREYRTRLVADVVTGKLDVREAAARLPDEIPPEIVENDADLTLDPDAIEEEATP